MNSAVKTIQRIIAEDSMTTSYKLATLRGSIDIIETHGPLVKLDGDRAILPFGLLIEKFLAYYYPLFWGNLPQIGGKRQLGFENSFKIILEYYPSETLDQQFFFDLENSFSETSLPVTSLVELFESVKAAIRKGPFLYIEDGHIFQYIPKNKETNSTVLRADKPLPPDHLLTNYGWYSIPRDFYEAFNTLGSFFTGRDNILHVWAKLSSRFAGGESREKEALQALMATPRDSRNTGLARQAYLKKMEKQNLYCVWSGKKITETNLVVDHALPFARIHDNGLWNLFPANAKINSQKSDSIPSPALIEKSQNRILEAWNLLRETNSHQFHYDLHRGLGVTNPGAPLSDALPILKARATNLIQTRGLPAYEG